MTLDPEALKKLAAGDCGDPAKVMVLVHGTTILSLVAAVEVLRKVRACRTDIGLIIGGHPGLTQLLPDMDAALHPFSHINGEQP